MALNVYGSDVREQARILDPSNPNERAQIQTVKTLAQMGDRDAMRLLIDVLKNERFKAGVRIEVAREFGRMQKNSDIDNALRDASKSGAETVRWTAQIAYYKHNPPKRPTKELNDIFENADNEDRKDVLDIFSQFRDEESFVPLLKLIDNYPVFYSRAESLTASAVYLVDYKPVVECLQNAGSKNTFIECFIKAIGNREQHLQKLDQQAAQLYDGAKDTDKMRFNPATDVAKFRSGLSRDFRRNANIQLYIPIIEALKSYKAEKAADPIGKLIRKVKIEDESDKRLCLTAIEALGLIGTRYGISALDSVMSYGDSELRTAAASALGSVGGPDAAEALKKYSEDKDERVKQAVSNALVEAQKPRETQVAQPKTEEPAKPEIQKQETQQQTVAGEATFSDLSSDQQMVKVKQLEYDASDSAISDLIKFLKSGYPEVRKESVRALGRLKVKEALADLTRISETDPDEGVRKAAKLSLVMIK